MNGSGTQLLTGSNSYTGATSITGGTLQTGNAYALSTSAVTQSGSGTLDLDGQTISNTLSLSGAGAGGLGALINSNTGTPAAVLGDIASNNFTVGGAGNLTLTTATNNNGIFTVTDIGPGALTLGGTTLNYLMAVNVNGGTVILAKGNATADNDWAIDRGATVTSGTLQIGAAGEQIGFDQGVTVNGGAFNLAGFNTSINFLAGTGGVVTSGSAAATLTVGTIQNGTSETTTTYSGVLQDGSAALSLVKTGTSTLTLSGNNTFSGGATVSAGTLRSAVRPAPSPTGPRWTSTARPSRTLFPSPARALATLARSLIATPARRPRYWVTSLPITSPSAARAIPP
jgi:autotransporter-associated beta strand protein